MRGILEIGEESAWGAGSASLAYLATKEVSFPTGHEYEPGDDITQYDAEDVGSILYQPGDVQIRCGLHPAVAEWPVGKPDLGDLPPIFTLLKSALGGALAGGYGVTTTGNTTTVLQFDPYGDTPATLGFKVGEPVWVRVAGGANVLGYNTIKTVNNTAFTVTLRSPVPSAPGDAAVVYGGFACPKLTTQTSTSLEALWTGEASYDVRQALACAPSSQTIAVPFRGLAELTTTLRSARPVPPDPSESGGGVSQQSYPYPEASQAIHGGLYLWDGAVNHKLTGGVDIDLGIELSEVPGINGVDPNGIAAFVLTARKIRVKLTPAYVDTTMWEVFQNPPASSVLTGWWGVGPRCWGFQIPQAIVVSSPSWTDEEGKINLSVEFGAAEYTGDTGTPGAADAIDKPFVIGCIAGDAS